MAKNKVFVTVLLALLAGCAVLIGCTGEGAGSVSKRGDNSVSVSDNLIGKIPSEPSEVGETEEREFPPRELGKFPGLDAETERRILQDCVDMGAWEISEYCGTYNGWVVVRVMLPHAGVLQIVTIGGFAFNVLPPVITWKDGQIYELKDAYDAGLLTPDDIKSIAECTLTWKDGQIYNEEGRK